MRPDLDWVLWRYSAKTGFTGILFGSSSELKLFRFRADTPGGLGAPRARDPAAPSTAAGETETSRPEPGRASPS